MNLRVAMIIQSYYPRVGGAERQVQTIIPLLKNRGCDVHVLTRQYPGTAPFEMVQGVPVHRLPSPGPKALASIWFTIGALRLLRKLSVDVIHSHELLSPTTTAVLAKVLYGTPVVANPHRGGLMGDIWKLHRRFLGLRRLAIFRKQVDAFISISHEIDNELKQSGISSSKRYFIPNGVDVERFAPASPLEKERLRHMFQLGDGPVLLYAGRLVSEKRVDQLLTVWPAIRKVFSNSTLLIAGTGEEENRLKKLTPEGARFLGNVSDIVPYLQAADLFVLPSVTEGLSVALLEALSTGLPAVATSVGGNPDVIHHGIDGWLVPPDQPAILQDSVLLMLADPNRRNAFGALARQKITERYSLNVIARRLFHLYKTLNGEEPTPDRNHLWPAYKAK